MLKVFTKILCLSILIGFACNESETSQISKIAEESSVSKSHGNADGGSISSRQENWSDSDNVYGLEIKEFSITVGPGQVNTGTVVVPSDYVIVGGGVQILDGNNHPNVFLTESRPDFGNNSWVASSKNHRYADSHSLLVTALGMKVCGNFDIRSGMQVFTSTSSLASHPSTSVSVPSNYSMIGGGAKVNYGSGYGNLLVSSYPSSLTTWTVESKDHYQSSQATITAYAIGINKDIYNWFDFALFSLQSYVSSGVSGASVYPNSGYLMTCPGSKITYNGNGRMMQEIFPGDELPVASTRSRDQSKGDSGYTTAYILSVKPTYCPW